jgi:hypothetical protein
MHGLLVRDGNQRKQFFNLQLQIGDRVKEETEAVSTKSQCYIGSTGEIP